MEEENVTPESPQLIPTIPDEVLDDVRHQNLEQALEIENLKRQVSTMEAENNVMRNTLNRIAELAVWRGRAGLPSQ